MEHITNAITVRGCLRELPRYSHENHGRRFYRFVLEVPRLSGAVDLLPVIAEEALVLELDPCAGEMVTVSGQIRSHNQRTDGIRRLIIFIFAFGGSELPLLLGSTLPKALSVQTHLVYMSPDLLQRPLAMAMNGVVLLLSGGMALLYSALVHRLNRKIGGVK